MNQFRTVFQFLTIILFIFLLSASKQAGAQVISEWKIGFSVDRTTLDLTPDFVQVSEFVTSENGFSVSVLPVFQINEDFSFITGLEYSYFSYNFPTTRSLGQQIEEVGNPHVSYLSLPLLLNLHFLENLRSVNFTGGFRISTRVASTSGTVRVRDSESDEQYTHFASQASNDILLAYTLGAGYRFPGRLQALGIDLLYNQDITPFFNVMSIDIGEPRQIRMDTWRRSFSLRLNYHF